MTVTETAPPRLLRVKEVAEILGCSEVYVRQLARDGKLRSIRFSREGFHRFDPRELERFIADRSGLREYGRAPARAPSQQQLSLERRLQVRDPRNQGSQSLYPCGKSGTNVRWEGDSLA
jgi:excisionase family DNA binding protein